MRSNRLIAWLVALFIPSAGLAAVLIDVKGSGDSNFFLFLPILLTGWVGALLLVRVPGNRIGWLLALGGVAGALSGVAAALLPSTDTPLTALPELSTFQVAFGFGAGAIGWFGLLFVWLVGIPLLFPDGRPPSPRWRWAVWLGGAALLVTVVLSVFAYEQCDQWQILDATAGVSLDDPAAGNGFRWAEACFDNPVGVRGLPDAETGFLGSLLTLFMLTAVVGALSSLVVRFRRAGAIERRQMKWVLFSFSLIVAAIAVGSVAEAVGRAEPISDWVPNLAFSFFPVSIAMAIFRYRLYEIDRVVSRTVSYGLVIGVLTAVFALFTWLPTYIIGGLGNTKEAASTSPPVVAASTLAVAILFNPLRKRVQRTVDRRFNRFGYQAETISDDFAAKLQQSLTIEEVREHWTNTIEQALQPQSIGIWLPNASNASRQTRTLRP